MITTEQPPQLKPESAPKPSRLARQSSPVAVILGYLIFVFLGGALAAPRFHAAAQFLESISYRFSFLADRAFHHFVMGSLILLAVVALPWLVKNLGLNSSSVLRLDWRRRHCGDSLLAFGWSFVAVALLACVLITFEARTFQTNHLAERWIRQLRNACLFALIIGILAELIFRGALFGALRPRGSFFKAAVLSSAVYALAFFVEKPEYATRWVQWNSGLIVLGQMFAGLANLKSMIPVVVNLVMLGCLLALLRERTGSLLPCIALHSGLVFWIKLLSFVSNPTKNANAFWGTDKIYDGWMTSIILVLVFILIERTMAPPKPASAE
ncbi:MAG TPA: CPBP family intramembrane glutamic endopeptidase [Verrucomicrobiae bacterium]